MSSLQRPTDQALADAGRALPKIYPTSDASLRMRAAVLEASSAGAATGPSRSTWIGALAVLALAVLGAAGWVATRASRSTAPTATMAIEPSPAIEYRAAVRNAGDARFVHQMGPAGEIVRLENGLISLDVAPLLVGERFRVVIGDAEVEVRGTSFDIAAFADHLTEVTVRSGVVEVRPQAAATVLLSPGGRWRANDGPERKEAKADPAEAPALRRSSASGSSRAFALGWERMQAHDHAGAAGAFSAVAGDPKDPFAEDALFWRAVALGRAERPREAELELERFRERYPKSRRHGEAAAMLGWLLLDRGEDRAAAQSFETALEDPLEEVQQSARSGLSKIRSGR